MPEKNPVKVSGKQLLETYRFDQQKISVLQRRKQETQQLLNEMAVATEALKEVSQAEKDETILVSLGAGVYAKARVENVKKVKSSLAGSVLVEQDTEEALERLSKEMENVKKELAKVSEEEAKTMKNIRNVAKLLEQGQKAMQSKSGEAEVSSVS